MKKTILSILLAGVLLTSCAAEKNIVAEFGFTTDDSGLNFTGLEYTPEIIAEISSHVVACEIVEIESGAISGDVLTADFKYEVRVVEEFLDTTDAVNVGDYLLVQCNEGLMPAAEAQKLMEFSGALRYLTGEYGENDYIRCSNHGALPVEVGKTYLMFLTDDYYEDYEMYVECGRQYLFEYDKNGLYAENDDAKGLSVNDIKTAIGSRTGRADEIGRDAYILELQAENQ